MLGSKSIKSSTKGLRKNAQERLSQRKPVPGPSPIVVLPAMALVSPHSNRHEVKPALAFKLLKDIEQSVIVWQTELRRVVSAIEALHSQGPMVDGWLDCSTNDEIGSTQATHDTETTLLRHGDTDTLMRYVEALESQELDQGSSQGLDRGLGQEIGTETLRSETPASAVADSAGVSTGAQYRLCWLDDEGNVCSQPCPPEQMLVVSTAIARYQKCKQLLARRQMLEARLQSVVDGLTDVRNTAQR